LAFPFDAFLLTYNDWAPTQKLEEINIPMKLRDCIESYEKYHHQREVLLMKIIIFFFLAIK
jgi:hypothetical protein